MKGKKLIVLIGVALLLFILGKSGYGKGFEAFGEYLIMPFVYGAAKVRNVVDGNFRALTFWKSGEERIRNLEQRNWELSGYMAKTKELQLENEVLRRQVGILPGEQRKMVLANVLSGFGDLVLDTGENSGVKIGNYVLFGNNFVGTIYKVTPKRSFVRLPTGTGARILVNVGSSRGEVVGSFNTSMFLDKIVQTERINVGDLIVTAGPDEQAVPNLVVGKVGEIKSLDSDVFVRAQVVSLIDYSRLEKVFIAL